MLLLPLCTYVYIPETDILILQLNLNIQKQLYDSVRQKFDEFYQNILEMEMTYGDMCTMFRENSTEIDPPILFGYVTQFVESFKVC